MMYKQGYFSKVNKNSRLIFIALSKEVKVRKVIEPNQKERRLRSQIKRY